MLKKIKYLINTTVYFPPKIYSITARKQIFLKRSLYSKSNIVIVIFKNIFIVYYLVKSEYRIIILKCVEKIV